MLIHNLEQGSAEWFRMRAGMPTASEASKLVTSTGKESKSLPELARVLAGDLYAGEPVDRWEGNAFTERGHELEDEARESYEFITGLTVNQVGFITDDLEQYGCSPDGLINDDGMLEIKNLIAKNHIKVLDYYDKHEKAPPDYIPQCQMQMLVAERKSCDLFYHHPKLPSLNIMQYPDSDLFFILERQIKEIIKERDRLVTMMEKQ